MTHFLSKYLLEKYQTIVLKYLKIEPGKGKHVSKVLVLREDFFFQIGMILESQRKPIH